MQGGTAPGRRGDSLTRGQGSLTRPYDPNPVTLSNNSLCEFGTSQLPQYLSRIAGHIASRNPFRHSSARWPRSPSLLGTSLFPFPQ